MQKDLVKLLETSMGYFENAQRYEVMSEVAKLLQPFYENARDAKVTHTHTHTHTHTQHGEHSC